MTQQEAREAAAVMLAFADGKKIEWIDPKVPEDRWDPCPRPTWNFEVFSYRVAPEPWTGKLWVHPDGRAFAPASKPSLDHEKWEKRGWRFITAKEVGDE